MCSVKKMEEQLNICISRTFDIDPATKLGHSDKLHIYAISVSGLANTILLCGLFFTREIKQILAE